ncbi:hypothetical protein SmJEL517_g01587 [Synchytrium microbalum]|uniref:GRAM domain-containing protein n=1 Tax=Synchytrium microbalum TaxID=1806994 RepID=A0A507C9G1_9FUNG|nr:uncharacterized protein SmJEL517_g01587 [Synchytrium microbalum]TPX36242.1 hypothetical protein SmJEL517_g01587 [Synchytrium microbalum]
MESTYISLLLPSSAHQIGTPHDVETVSDHVDDIEVFLNGGDTPFWAPWRKNHANKDYIIEETTNTVESEKVKFAFDLTQVEDYEGDFACWLSKSVLTRGHMFVTTEHICFYTSLPQDQPVTKSGYLSIRCQPTATYSIRKLTVDKWAEALVTLTTDTKIADKIKVLGAKIRSEHGVGQPVKFIYRELEY